MSYSTNFDKSEFRKFDEQKFDECQHFLPFKAQWSFQVAIQYSYKFSLLLMLYNLPKSRNDFLYMSDYNTQYEQRVATAYISKF